MFNKIIQYLFTDCIICKNESIFKFYMCIECFNKLNFRNKTKDEYIVPLQYNEVIKYLLLKFKYNNEITLANIFVDLIYTILPSTLDNPIFVPIPTTRYKLFQRTYNPAVELAKYLAIKYNGKMSPFVLLKNKTTTQRDKDMKERLKNASFINLSDKQEIINQNIYIVDDLISSGATVERAKILLEPYVNSINIIAIAKT